jgi:hypothetical protein
MTAAGKTVEMKIYPPFGRSPQDGHSFGYFGAASWEQDVFGFSIAIARTIHPATSCRAAADLSGRVAEAN